MIPANKNTTTQITNRAGALRDATPNLIIKDQVSLGNKNGVDPALQGKPNFDKPDPDPDKKTESDGLPMTWRFVGGAMAGLTLMTAMTGCTRQPGVPNVPLTQEQKQAQQELSQRMTQIQESMKDMQGGTGQQQSERLTRQVLDAAKDYAKKTGRSGPGLENDLRNLLMDHPALAITTMFAVGTATGVVAEKMGLTDGISKGASGVYEWAKNNKLAAAGIVVALGVGTAVVINQIASTEAKLPDKPNTAEGRTLEATFARLEEQISANPNIDAKDVNRQVLDAVNQYHTSSGRTWDKVRDDVVAFAYEHPILATTAITGAGVATGVVLEHAGVPNKVAGLIGSALDTGGNAAKSVVDYAKAHPVVAGAVGVGVAVGVGYLAYEHFGK